MKLIIETIEKAIEHEKWSIDFHEKEIAMHKEKLNQLTLELATLKVQLREPTKGHEHNSPLYNEAKMRQPFPNVDTERFLNQKD